MYFSETTLFSVQSSSAKEFNFDFCVSTQSSVLFWSWLMTCSFHVSLLFDLSIKLLSELMILSSALMNSRFVIDFDLREREKFRFSLFDLRRNHLWSYWVEWELVLIVQLCSITCRSIWCIICFCFRSNRVWNFCISSAILNSMKSARHFWKQCTHHFWKFKSMKNYYWTKVYSNQELSKGKSSTLLTFQHLEKHLNQMICHLQSYSKHTKLYWKSSI